MKTTIGQLKRVIREAKSSAPNDWDYPVSMMVNLINELGPEGVEDDLEGVGEDIFRGGSAIEAEELWEMEKPGTTRSDLKKAAKDNVGGLTYTMSAKKLADLTYDALDACESWWRDEADEEREELEAERNASKDKAVKYKTPAQEFLDRVSYVMDDEQLEDVSADAQADASQWLTLADQMGPQRKAATKIVNMLLSLEGLLQDGETRRAGDVLMHAWGIMQKLHA
jgi:hypothetical protein